MVFLSRYGKQSACRRARITFSTPERRCKVMALCCPPETRVMCRLYQDLVVMEYVEGCTRYGVKARIEGWSRLLAAPLDRVRAVEVLFRDISPSTQRTSCSFIDADVGFFVRLPKSIFSRHALDHLPNMSTESAFHIGKTTIALRFEHPRV